MVFVTACDDPALQAVEPEAVDAVPEPVKTDRLARCVPARRSMIVNRDVVAGTRRDEASRRFLRIQGPAAERPVGRAHAPLFKAMQTTRTTRPETASRRRAAA